MATCQVLNANGVNRLFLFLPLQLLFDYPLKLKMIYWMCDRFSSQSNIWNEQYQELSSEEDCDCDDVESGRCQGYVDKYERIDDQNDSNFVPFLRGWFSYSRLMPVRRTKSKVKTYPSRTCDFLGGFRNILQLYGSKNYYRRNSNCRED